MKDILYQFHTLLKATPKDQRAKFEAYIQHLVDHDKCYGIDLSFLGFIDDYILLSKILACHSYSKKGPKKSKIPSPTHNFIVFDIGACTAVQHVLFKNCVRYIAIDYGLPKPKFFTTNCDYIKGKFVDLIKSKTLVIPKDTDNVSVFGIANMSLLYQHGNEEDITLFNQVFKRKFII
jgi:hypothetical protein